MIHAKDLIYNYIKTDEEGNAEGFCTALDHVDLDVSPGEFIAILGHNGSGKSTLAKNINALLRLSGGTLYVDGKDVRDASKILEIRKSAGMIFQNPDNQIIASVVEEDVAFGPENLGVPTEEIKRRVHESLDSVGMSAYSRKSPDRLSGGQKQKVAIAGVLAMEPECIIMDEPTAMLDPKGRGEVMAAAHKLNREENITVILITHNMEEAVDADRIFVMDKGRVVMHGTP
ncbi:MAG: energy-coupling factor transporter ATPase, partial [Lachnospiraceae bacterium]|nr:energy-coupling factor transporter ATPase [Lachnospiraceae bacterium]